MPIDPPRIAIVTPYWEPIVGGITTYTANLTSGLRALGAEAAVWTANGDPSEGVRVGPHSKRAFVRWVHKELRAWRPDVVHAQAHWYCLAPAVGPGRKRLAPRVVFSTHTAFLPATWPRRLWFERLLRKADVLTAVSTPSQASFQSLFPRAKHPVILPPGVRELHSRPADVEAWRDRLGLGHRHPILSAVSMLVWPRKVAGLKRLVESIANLRQTFPEAILLVVGDGELRREVEDTIGRLGLDRNVRLLGALPDPGPILSLSDIACHISYQDSFAQTILEAMSMARPVVVTDASAIDFPSPPEMCGLELTRPDPEAIASACAALAADEGRRRLLGERGLRTVREHFSRERSARVAWGLYGLAG